MDTVKTPSRYFGPKITDKLEAYYREGFDAPLWGLPRERTDYNMLFLGILVALLLL